MDLTSYMEDMIAGFEEEDKDLSLKEREEIDTYQKVREKLLRFTDPKDPTRCKTCD